MTLRRFIYNNLLFWILHSLFFALKEFSALTPGLVAIQFVAFFVGGFAISCVYHIRLKRVNIYSRGLATVLKSIVGTVAPLAIFVVLYDFTIDTMHYKIGFASDPNYHWVLFGYFIDGFIIFAPWFLLYHCYQYGKYAGAMEKDRALKDIELGKAKLRSLLHKLNPHFLFNTLNTIRWLIISDAGRARLAVDDLAEILRYTTKATEQAMVPLSMEMDVVERYLKMEGTRFENLAFKITCDDRLMEIEIPPFLILNLVENAITHGISQQTGPAVLEIEIYQFNKKIEIRVVNTGMLKNTHTGFGIESLKRMLLLHFGQEAELTLRQEENKVISTASISAYAS